MMATSQQTQPKADQPRVQTGSLKKTESMPSLTRSQSGVKNASGGRTQRDYARQGR